jgi:hypothetical protein
MDSAIDEGICHFHFSRGQWLMRHNGQYLHNGCWPNQHPEATKEILWEILGTKLGLTDELGLTQHLNPGCTLLSLENF